MSFAVKVDNLNYYFPGREEPVLKNIDLEIPWNTRTLMVGCNGAGKSTILKLLSGKNLCLNGNILVNDHNPFSPIPTDMENDNIINCVYLGVEWAHMEIINRDISVIELLQSIGFEHFKDRCLKLLEILEVQLEWRMHQLSDGQKRRVQLVMGLMKPWRVLLLDEVTVDLDVIGRNRILEFLIEETQSRRCSVIYATHIFDGLNNWPDKIIHLNQGRIQDSLPLANIQFSKVPNVTTHTTNNIQTVIVPQIDSLHPLALHWLYNDKALEQ